MINLKKRVTISQSYEFNARNIYHPSMYEKPHNSDYASFLRDSNYQIIEK